jgi:hypothetical protein
MTYHHHHPPMTHPPLPTTTPDLTVLDRLRSVARVGCQDPERAVQSEQVYDWFRFWNDRIFSNQLSPVLVNVALTPYGGMLGLCHGGPVQFIEIHPACWDGAAAHHGTIGSLKMPDAAFVVLHEMIHLAVDQAGLPSRGTDGNCHTTPGWVGWCNHAAEVLEIPLTYVSYKRAKSGTAEGRHNVRVPVAPPTLRPGTELATYDETRSFPCRLDAAIIQKNATLTKAGSLKLPTF